MSTEKLAKILNVDEVALHHGPKGVALYVRIEKSWQGVTIDNEDLEETHGKKRVEVMAHKLADLSDQLNKSLGREETFRKTQQPEDKRMLSWADVGGFQRWDSYDDGRQRQVQRYQPPPPRAAVPVVAGPEPTVSKSLPSRFHAIVEELSKL